MHARTQRRTAVTHDAAGSLLARRRNFQGRNVVVQRTVPPFQSRWVAWLRGPSRDSWSRSMDEPGSNLPSDPAGGSCMGCTPWVRSRMFREEVLPLRAFWQLQSIVDRSFVRSSGRLPSLLESQSVCRIPGPGGYSRHKITAAKPVDVPSSGRGSGACRHSLAAVKSASPCPCPTWAALVASSGVALAYPVRGSQPTARPPHFSALYSTSAIAAQPNSAVLD